MKTSPLNIDKNERLLLIDVLEEAKKSASYSDTAVRRSGTRITDGLLTKLRKPLDNQQGKSDVLAQVRADRKANAEFWKANIDKMFDKEIATYTILQQERKEK